MTAIRSECTLLTYRWLDRPAADPWSRFDFFLVCAALGDQFAESWVESVLPVPPMLLRVLRVLRVLRILRLLKGAQDLRTLIMTMVYSFPALVNVCAVLALITFIYAVRGHCASPTWMSSLQV